MVEPHERDPGEVRGEPLAVRAVPPNDGHVHARDGEGRGHRSRRAAGAQDHGSPEAARIRLDPPERGEEPFAIGGIAQRRGDVQPDGSFPEAGELGGELVRADPHRHVLQVEPRGPEPRALHGRRDAVRHRIPDQRDEARHPDPRRASECSIGRKPGNESSAYSIPRTVTGPRAISAATANVMASR